VNPKRTFLALSALSLALALTPAAWAHKPDAPSLDTVVLFNSVQLETPESIAISPSGDIFISLALTGEIRRIAPDGTQSTVAVLPIGPPLTICGPFLNAVTGITLDPHGDLFVSVVSCELEHRGIWKVSQDGSAEILATLPLASIPNGIAVHQGWVYVADSSQPFVWRAPVDRADTGEAEVWLDSPLLAGVFSPGLPLPGANGLQVFRGEVYVSNSTQGTIIAIPFEPDGSAGTPRVHGVMPEGTGCDDFAFDVHGSLYCTTDPTNLLVRMDPDSSIHILLTVADGLDGPTSATFGRTGQDRFNLYINSGAFPFFSTTHRPSLMRLHLDVQGAPPNW
jgi:sugar lactone lactonase YvrE